MPDYVAGLHRACAAIRSLVEKSGQETFTRAEVLGLAAVLDHEADREVTPAMGLKLCPACNSPIPVTRDP
jgi:hypothetical protein